ncbi:YdeI/OmpD-associated family protein (plasmid) [Deinococcus sp. KNUC1210]|uniref:YdeI/OmpD-associated family protein n=1 Tax=Deinococcus sp. KNUC1210 TaxID=2917691 RepID=UPI001EF0B7EE|nr:YdeI/OmpD-associated family protein [Deinococcus sp. KNUC1210]ULH17002.1 YdeI/OmpD-associated family protein [Deinococcus sp. KNUC1210]
MPMFTAILKQEGKTATGIEVPPEVMDALGGGKKPAITVVLNAHTYRTTIGVRGGHSMIPVSAENRGKAGLTAGDTVSVTVELDTEPREVRVPDDLQAALDLDPAALAAFSKLSYSGKQQHTLSVEGTTNPETRARRVAKAIETLTRG